MSNPCLSLIDLLAKTVDQFPDNDAFISGKHRLSYAELWQSSRRLSRCLDQQGVQSQEAVAIVLPRCLEASISVYGVMYGSHVWVPIDPLSPTEVIHQILVDNHCRVLITHPVLSQKIEKLLTGKHALHTVIGLDENITDQNSVTFISWSHIGTLPESDKPPQPQSDDIAYIIHTSGSTGRPKGIVHTHYSGASYAALAAQTFTLSENDVVACHGPLHTDMCTLGLLAAPSVGACTNIIPDAYVKVPASLSAYIESNGITVWYSVPQAIVQLITGGVLHKRNLHSLRWVIYAGESIAPKRLLQLIEWVPNAQLCNVYGPAETNQCMHHVIEGEKELTLLDANRESVPIGNVWAETSILLIDHQDQPVVRGAIGELLVHSSTMMKGYVRTDAANDNSAKRSVFFTDSKEGKRFYRTGDLAKLLPNGSYSLVGRRDRQVKVRGMRVELDAIELLLTQHPNVINAAVVKMCDESDSYNISIRAAVTTQENCDHDSISDYLRSRLPIHAIPNSIQVIEAMPLTSGAKLDRLKLIEQMQW